MEASNEYFSRLSPENVDREAGNAWDEYLKELESRDTTPTDLPQRYWPRVRKELREKGVQVPDSWKPYDRDGFIRHFKESYRNRVEREFQEKSRQVIGSAIEPGLSWGEFLDHPGVVKHFESRSELLKQRGLPDRITKESLLEFYYEPLFAEKLREHKVLFTAGAGSFAGGARCEEKGKEAMYMVVVPPIALLFSVAGALVHAVKTGNYFIKLFPVPRLFRWGFWACLLVAAGIYVGTHSFTNPVTESKLFRSLNRSVVQRYGQVPAWTMKGIIEFQPYFYPVNERLKL